MVPGRATSLAEVADEWGRGRVDEGVHLQLVDGAELFPAGLASLKKGWLNGLNVETRIIDIIGADPFKTRFFICLE